jgi:hypothetical protein
MSARKRAAPEPAVGEPVVERRVPHTINLHMLANRLWARFAELAVHYTAHPTHLLGELHPNCPRSILGHLRFPSQQFDSEQQLVVDVTCAISCEADARVVVESASAAALDEETLDYALNGCCYDHRLALQLLKYPKVLSANNNLVTALTSHLHCCYDERIRTGLLAAVAANPTAFEHPRVVALLAREWPSAKEWSDAVRILSHLDPRALHSMNAGEMLANMIGDACGSSRRLKTIERLIKRIESPAHIDAGAELASAMTPGVPLPPAARARRVSGSVCVLNPRARSVL